MIEGKLSAGWKTEAEWEQWFQDQKKKLEETRRLYGQENQIGGHWRAKIIKRLIANTKFFAEREKLKSRLTPREREAVQAVLADFAGTEETYGAALAMSETCSVEIGDVEIKDGKAVMGASLPTL